MGEPRDNPELTALIARALAYVKTLTPEEHAEMVKRQRESWVRAEMAWPAPKFKWVNGAKVYESYADYCA